MNTVKPFIEIQKLINAIGPTFGYPLPFDFSKYAFTKHEGVYLKQLQFLNIKRHERGAHLDPTNFNKIIADVNAIENFVEQLSYVVDNTTGSPITYTGTLIFSASTEIQVDYGNGIKVRNKAFIINLSFTVAANTTKTVKLYFKDALQLISIVSASDYLTTIGTLAPFKNLITVNLQSNALLIAKLNTIITELDTNGKINGVLSLNGQANTQIATNTTGVTSLQGKGWTVTI